MRRKLSESVVVITGASSGVGLATALQLANEKAALVLAARSGEALEAAAAECEKKGALTLVVPTDVTIEEQVENLARVAIDTFGRIDAWINNAGVGAYSRFEETPGEVIRQVMETNFFGCVHGAKAVLPYFREQDEGVLINVSSSAGKVGVPFMAAYSASKFAVNGFSESLRMELRDTPKIRVCNVVPGSIDTPFFWHAANYTGLALKPMQPMLKPDEVAAAIVRCVERPRAEVFVGALSRLSAFAHIFPHAWMDRIISSKVRRDHFEPQAEASGEGNVFSPAAPYNAVSGRWRELLQRKQPILAISAAVLAIALGALYFRRRHFSNVAVNN